MGKSSKQKNVSAIKLKILYAFNLARIAKSIVKKNNPKAVEIKFMQLNQEVESKR